MSELTYKKITDVDVVEALNDAATVFINDNGAMKQVAADKLGAVKTVNGVEPDENGNIVVEVPSIEGLATTEYVDEKVEGLGGGEVSWNDLTDKPFGGFYRDSTRLEDVTLNEGTSIGQGFYKYTVDSGTGWSGFATGVDYCLTVNGVEHYGRAESTSKLTINGFYFTSDGEGKYDITVSRNVDFAVISLHEGAVYTLPLIYIAPANAVSNATGDTPTASEFNALLYALRDAGFLRT